MFVFENDSDFSTCNTLKRCLIYQLNDKPENTKSDVDQFLYCLDWNNWFYTL